MNSSSFCCSCGKPLSHDEIALHKKLYNRGSEAFFCLQCSSGYLEVSVEMLQQKIREFKSMGCTLFEE